MFFEERKNGGRQQSYKDKKKRKIRKWWGKKAYGTHNIIFVFLITFYCFDKSFSAYLISARSQLTAIQILYLPMSTSRKGDSSWMRAGWVNIILKVSQAQAFCRKLKWEIWKRAQMTHLAPTPLWNNTHNILLLMPATKSWVRKKNYFTSMKRCGGT